MRWSIREQFLPRKMVFNVRDFGPHAFHLFVGWSWDKLIKKSITFRFLRTFWVPPRNGQSPEIW